MPEENNETSQKRKDGPKGILKGIGIVLVVLLAIIVVGFGLIVGFCALSLKRH
jgi:hypothetical protein